MCKSIDVRMWRCVDVEMWMWRCKDVEMSRCGDA